MLQNTTITCRYTDLRRTVRLKLQNPESVLWTWKPYDTRCVFWNAFGTTEPPRLSQTVPDQPEIDSKTSNSSFSKTQASFHSNGLKNYVFWVPVEKNGRVRSDLHYQAFLFGLRTSTESYYSSWGHLSQESRSGNTWKRTTIWDGSSFKQLCRQGNTLRY